MGEPRVDSAVPGYPGHRSRAPQDTRTEVILEPKEFRTGEVVDPTSRVKK